MSLLYKSNKYSFIDHRHYVSNIYQSVSVTDTETISLALLSKLFSIISHKKEGNRKRNHSSEDFYEDTTKVRDIYDIFIVKIPAHIKQSIRDKYKLLDTTYVRDLSKTLFESTVFDHGGIKGGNNSDKPMKCKVKDDYFLVPPKSRFFCGCVKEYCQKLDGNKFDILIADPPWWNKYIRRLKSANNKLSYSMMYNEDIASIPVKNLLSTNCLVAVWCTNAPSNVSAVKNLIFPEWGIQYLTTWYWLKVTADLEPLCPFGAGYKKQPYERLILGKVGEVRDIPESQLIISVPSALHSHKPPLIDILSPYVDVEEPQILELFARYLLPNTTSVGYEPLKWQHISLYETVT